MSTLPSTGHFDPLLVALSVAVAVFGAYTALDLAQHARAARDQGAGRRFSGWLAAAACTLGAGIWSMHFIGMLAFRMPMAVHYDVGLTTLSLLLAVAVSGAGLFAVARNVPRRFTIPVAGTLTGLGIVTMHYVGMAGMQVPARLTYDSGLVGLSVAVAIAASTAAMWLAFRTAHARQRLLGALVLGLAVVAMHYVGMSAATFHAMETPPVPVRVDAAVGPPLLAVGVSLATVALLGMALASSVVDRQRAADRTAEHEARYRAVVDSAVDPIVLIDGAGTILSFNPAAERTFGYAGAEVMGSNVCVLMPEPDRSAHDGYIARYRATGERRIIGIGREVTGRRRDGSTFPLELSVAEWRAGGTVYYTGIMRDISERKAAETALRAATAEAERAREEAVKARDAAERADVAKSKFLAAASHDLRQPVQSLFFFAHALSDRLDGHPAADMLASMSGSLDALKGLLDSILDVSRLDAGVVQPNVTEFALGPLLARIAAEYAPRAAEAGLRLRHVPTRAWTRSDPVLLERALRNLLENALRYTVTGGIVLGCRRRDGTLRIVVADSGIGIPAGKLPEIFEEFTQLGNPERDRRKGLGLGLAIVRRLASLLGHEVTVRSQPGRGSTFALEVPAAAARALPRAVNALPPQPDGKGLILVIDDDTVILVSMRAMLEQWGYEVAAAVSADEAIELLLGLGRAPRAILADYRLREGRTGVEAIRDVFGVCGVRVPAVVITGDTAPERIAEVERSGFRLLHKPVTPARLREVLASAA
ncbi:hybrid sensor histidine kinase/response regulator [Azospirillum halopraeferens]|uniref:hybrid sensor histidine kinase/response regulator n=1 Tax=Azospirillum halopraeferens TaxID=34010 RepID=UPI00040E301D|nr:MHYT domain-containing protein [Azospirillum halopraeferens]